MLFRLSLAMLALAGVVAATPVASNPCPRTSTTFSMNGITADQWYCGNSVGGSTSTGGWVDAFGSDNSAYPSSFNYNLISIANATVTASLPFKFSTIPYVTGLLSELYFVFTYDAQETGQDRQVQLAQFSLSVGGTTIWSATDIINLNDDPTKANHTLTPQGNGADLAVYVPVWAFNGLGLTGNSDVILTAYELLADNGNDEWILTDYGIKTPWKKFNPGDPIHSPDPYGGTSGSVPEPGTWALMGSMAGLVALWQRRRTNAVKAATSIAGPRAPRPSYVAAR